MFHRRSAGDGPLAGGKKGVRSVSMQSTGVYFMPVLEVLEQQGLEVCLVNAQHANNVPGRKSHVHHHPAAGVSMLAEATRFWPAE
jgi:hypothetical protein